MPLTINFLEKSPQFNVCDTIKCVLLWVSYSFIIIDRNLFITTTVHFFKFCNGYGIKYPQLTILNKFIQVFIQYHQTNRTQIQIQQGGFKIPFQVNPRVQLVNPERIVN